ncbi:MAG: hypothetical protein MJY66_07620, partial [Bacteroidaceae bacterium]|nr:hypothetical protein [Bacteroidaceae bacterium]
MKRVIPFQLTKRHTIHQPDALLANTAAKCVFEPSGCSIGTTAGTWFLYSPKHIRTYMETAFQKGSVLICFGIQTEVFIF